LPAKQFGNFQRAAECARGAEVIVGGFRRFLTGKREGLGIQSRVIQNQRDVAVVLHAAVSTGISKRIATVLSGSAAAAAGSTETTTASAAEASTPAAETSTAAGTATAWTWTGARLRAGSAGPVHTKTIRARTARSARSETTGAEAHPVVLLGCVHAIADTPIHDEGLRGALIEIAPIQAGRRRLSFRWQGPGVLRVHIERLESAARE
jgi:hypothetical protein